MTKQYGWGWKHGHAGKHVKTSEYNIWRAMRARCANPKNPDYKSYGGRGISVCERWQDFSIFLSDMGERPSKNHSLDRIDNDGNYEPGNVRWATIQEQASNTSRSVAVVRSDGAQFRTITEAGEHTGIHYSGIQACLKGRQKSAGGYQWSIAPNLSLISKLTNQEPTP